MSRKKGKDETRDRVRKAAWELFSDVGYEATTTKSIAERAGVATGTVFVHATDKADLLRSVVYTELERIVEEGTQEVGKGALVDEWLRLFSRLLVFYGQNRKVSEAFLSVTMAPALDAMHSGYALEVTMRFLGVLAGLVEQAKTRGDVREDVGSLLAAQAAFALYFSVLSAWLQGFSSTEGAIASLRDLLTLLVRGLGPAEAPKKKAPKKRAGRSPR
ncbi:MAG: TetR/AcrR family transcriptional regulator [Myxococcales bacterium]|jgi:AcrR family transcriptional regulator|nr:TetR/AcrR family transcriptional regulator [Myxococcales bacterium]